MPRNMRVPFHPRIQPVERRDVVSNRNTEERRMEPLQLIEMPGRVVVQ